MFIRSKTIRTQTQTFARIFLCIWFLTACSPQTIGQKPLTPTVPSPPIVATVISSPTPSADTLSQIIWASDPCLPKFDPNSSAYAEFPTAVNQISEMGEDAIDAADDLAVAIRFPRQDSYLAAQALLKLGPDITLTVLNLLRDNLNDKKPETLIYSVIMIGSVGNNASCAVGNIAPLLWDPDPYVRSSAAIALEKITDQDFVPPEYETVITPSFLANSISPDIPEGKVTGAARTWWNEKGSTINWHPSYGLCDP